MKTQTQIHPELIQLCRLIEEMTIGMITSVDASGALVSRPMAPLEMDSSGIIWFFTDISSGKVGHLNPANLSFTNESRGTYISISGIGEINTDREHIERLWTAFAKPWFPDGPESVNLALLKFIPNTAEYWDAPHSKMVRMFAMAASVVIGKPLMGEHGTLTELTSTF